MTRRDLFLRVLFGAGAVRCLPLPLAASPRILEHEIYDARLSLLGRVKARAEYRAWADACFLTIEFRPVGSWANNPSIIGYWAQVDMVIPREALALRDKAQFRRLYISPAMLHLQETVLGYWAKCGTGYGR